MEPDKRLAGRLKALRRWAAISRVLLIGCMVVCAAWLAVVAAVLLAGRPSESEALIVIAAGLSLIATPLVLFPSTIAISIWTHRAHANLRLLGIDGMGYAPGWAVASAFVPIVNLIVPFRAMRELYNRSFGEAAHFASQSVPNVSSWWSCYVVGNLILTVLAAMAAVELATPVYFTTPPVANALLILFALLLLAGAAFFLRRIIGAVTAAQNSVTGVGDTFA